MPEIAKLFIIAGLVLVLVGITIWIAGQISWIGKLPGDISIKKGNFQIYFPIMTCIIISVVLTVIFNLFRK